MMSGTSRNPVMEGLTVLQLRNPDGERTALSVAKPSQFCYRIRGRDPASTKNHSLVGGHDEAHSIQGIRRTGVHAKSHMANYSSRRSAWHPLLRRVVRE